MFTLPCTLIWRILILGKGDSNSTGGSSERRNLKVQLSNLILPPQKLSNISSTVATALYTLANDGTAPDFDIKADEALVSRSPRILWLPNAPDDEFLKSHHFTPIVGFFVRVEELIVVSRWQDWLWWDSFLVLGITHRPFAYRSLF